MPHFKFSKKKQKDDMNSNNQYFVDNKMMYSEIVVPTFDSIRMQYLTRILILNKKHVLCPGPTGTGKTVNI